MEKVKASNEGLPVAVIFGGAGAEHTISLRSAEAVLSALERLRVPVLKIGIKKDGGWYIYSGSVASLPCGDWERGELTPTYPVRLGAARGFYKNGEIIPVSVAVVALHGDFGEDGAVQGALTTAGIDYVGCGVTAGAICTDKAYTKMLAEHVGIPTVPWVLYIKRKHGSSARYGNVCLDKTLAISEAVARFGFPMFVKPSGLGSSIGAARVNTEEQLLSAIDVAADVGDGRVLIERAINVSAELECAYLSIGKEELYTAPGSISTESGFYDFSAKYEGRGQVSVNVTSALCEDIKRKLRDFCERLTSLLGIRQISRMDFLMGSDGEIYFNEVNTFPGMTESSLYPLLIADAGIEFDGLIAALIDGARL